MRNITEIFSVQSDLPVGLRHLHVAAYCRISTKLEEQNNSIESQKRALFTVDLPLLGKRRNIFRKINRSEFERTA